MPFMLAKTNHTFLCWLPCLTILACSLVAVYPIFNADFWLIQETGAWILANGRMPTADPFAFTTTDSLWIEHKWLFDIVVYLLWEHTGSLGLIALKTLLTTAIVLVVLWPIRRSWLQLVIVGSLLLLLFAAFPQRFSVRAHLAAYLCLTVFVAFLLRADFSRRRSFVLPVVVQLLWTNLHGSFLLGPLIVSALLFGKLINQRLQGSASSPEKVKPYVILLSLLVATMMVNPYGIYVFLPPIQHMFLGFAGAVNLAEWQAVSFSEASLPLRALCLTLLAIPVAVFMMFRQTKQDFCIWLLLLLFGFLAWRSLRFVAPAALVFTVLVAISVAKFMEQQRWTIKPLMRLSLLSAYTLALVLVVVSHVSRLISDPPFYVDDRIFPKAATHFLSKQSIGGNLFNSFNYGTYLAGHLYPSWKIYIDGRLDLYKQETFKDYYRALEEPGFWEKLTSRYDIDAILLAYESHHESQPFLQKRLDSKEWALVYFDEHAVLLLKRTSENIQVIEKHELRHLKVDPSLRYVDRVINGSVEYEAMLEEIRRLAQGCGECPLPYLIEARLLKQQVDINRQVQACQVAEMGYEKHPHFLPLLLEAGLCFASLQKYAKGERLLGKARDFAELRELAFENLGLLYAKQGELERARQVWLQGASEFPENQKIQRMLKKLQMSERTP